MAFLLLTAVPPINSSSAVAASVPWHTTEAAQQLSVDGNYTQTATRDTFTASEVVVAAPEPTVSAVSSAPAAGTPDPGTAQAIAYQLVAERGWSVDEYSCLVALWDRESGWNVYAYNPSGAYGIPQALPGDKMSAVDSDWATNPTTQILWGLAYIAGSYGTPCGAWSHSESSGWY